MKVVLRTLIILAAALAVVGAAVALRQTPAFAQVLRLEGRGGPGGFERGAPPEGFGGFDRGGFERGGFEGGRGEGGGLSLRSAGELIKNLVLMAVVGGVIVAVSVGMGRPGRRRPPGGGRA